MVKLKQDSIALKTLSGLHKGVIKSKDDLIAPLDVTWDKELFECALEAERDEELNVEMSDWELTVRDGIDSES